MAENTFRPPYFHRNVMSEFMGLIHGVYDAKAEGVSCPAAPRCTTACPPTGRTGTFEKAAAAALSPQKIAGHAGLHVRDAVGYPADPRSSSTNPMQRDYDQCWSGFEKLFRG